MTAWRFRRRGWLTTVNICGRVYVTEEACRDFVRRAEAGEFAKEPALMSARAKHHAWQQRGV